jgi:hypothetical protein
MCPPLVVAGHEVPRQQEARVLGLMFDAQATAARMLAHRADVYAAQFGIVVAGLRLSRSHRAHSVLDAVYLTRVVAEAAGLYGCGVWGVWHCAPGLAQFYALGDPLEQRRCRLLRGLLRLPKDTPRMCLLHELGLRPLVHTYLLSAVKLYNALLAGGPMFSALLRQNACDALERTPAVPNWAHHLHAALQFVHPRGQWRRRFLAQDPQPLPFGAVRKALGERYNDRVALLKEQQPGCRGSWQGWYFREVCTHALGAQPAYLRRRIQYGVEVDCLRFRLGVHHLQVRLGRQARPRPVPRARRYCLRCTGQNTLDDERHCLFHCGHPRLVAARAQLQPVLQGVVCRTVADLFRAAGQQSGAIRRVVRYVALCQRVAAAARAEREGPAAPLPAGVGVPAAQPLGVAGGEPDEFGVWDNYFTDDEGSELELADSESGLGDPAAQGGSEDESELVEVELPDGVVLPDDLYT